MPFDLPRAERAFRDLLAALGVSADDPAFRQTPQTAARALAGSLLSGYDSDPRSALGRGFPVAAAVPVVATRIPLLFVCPHHLLPAQGEAHIAFMPNDRVPGLARIFRLVDVLSRRLVLQEDLTHAIAEALYTHLPARAAIAVVEASHFCVAVDDFARRNATFRTKAALGQARLIASLEREIDASLRSAWATCASSRSSGTRGSKSPSPSRRSSPGGRSKRTSSRARR